MNAVAHVHHRVPGRLRLRIPQRRGDTGYFQALADALTRIEGIARVECNARTASVLVLHDGDAETILNAARAQQLFELGVAGAAAETMAQRAGTGMRTLDEGLRRMTRGDIDLRSLILGGFVAMGVVQLARGHVMGPAVTLFWYAYQLLGKSDDAKRLGKS